MKRLFLTGHDGFVGRTLRGLLAGRGGDGPEYEVILPTAEYDLRDPASIERAIAGKPLDCVIHLAAQSFVPESFRDPKQTFEVNFIGTLNLFQALQRCEFRGRLLYVSSAEVYGRVEPSEMPIDEAHPLRPRSPYGVSKMAAEALCDQWSQTEALDVMIARPFNHIGPGQSERFVVSSFARQLAEIKLGRRDPVIAVGDVDVTRDVTDARDVVKAYLLLLEHGSTAEVYNVCSGREFWIRDILTMLIDLSGVEARFFQDPAKLRTTDQPRLLGSFDRLHRRTGWIPGIDLRTSLRDTLAQWERDLAGA
jgi:GDP-4-dehydro-6-deoxy-D-mannose reductase